MLLQVIQVFAWIVTIVTRKIHIVWSTGLRTTTCIHTAATLTPNTCNVQHLTPADRLSQDAVPRAYSTVVKSQTKNTSQILSNSTD